MNARIETYDKLPENENLDNLKP